MAICSVPGCDKKATHRDWCNAHYSRWARHGDPQRDRPVAGKARKGAPWRFFTNVVLAHTSDECLFWPYARISSGYGTIQVAGKTQLVTRMLCEAAYGPPPTPKHEAAHSCGKGHLGCVARSHLSWKTQPENNADKIIHDTHNRGARCPAVKLTEAEVRRIRALRGTVAEPQIASMFGVSRGAVNHVLRRTTWAWLK